ncbi:DUF4215 domain-containing protein [Myxococcus llanfairpwllgwyngyllgogerychwyrndrobwllllantysiliogogogochensis]|nr:DUF4215 domain-containing protein [Myxococcus llanfairpwllgwyngyllgogerychwyrndrobwllllantysiliogogogochensis]
MRSRTGSLLSWGLGATLALLLGSCGVESLDDGGSDGALTYTSEESSLTWDPYADAVASGTTGTVLNASAAVGAPDGQAATLLSLLNTALVLDLGAGEEGTGDLRVYYQGLSLALVAQVDFLKADGTLIGSSPLHLVELGLGTHVAVATYPGHEPYRYVRLRGAVLALYLVDAVETSIRPICGDGVPGGVEVCDDGNQLSGDGCNSVCQVETGYTCAGAPSVCTDIDECALGTGTCAPGEVCVNTPGGFECEEEEPTCNSPRLVCGESCVDPNTDNNHCGGCGNVCAQGKSCVSGVCVGTGNLQFTATWSRGGDADLYVRTPSGKVISFENTGPDEGTDFGALDVDDLEGDGPENIFWAPDQTPPSGTYDFCLSVIEFNHPPSPGNPLNYDIKVRVPGQPDRVFPGAYTSVESSSNCAPGEPTYVGSVTYP